MNNTIYNKIKLDMRTYRIDEDRMWREYEQYGDVLVLPFDYDGLLFFSQMLVDDINEWRAKKDMGVEVPYLDDLYLDALNRVIERWEDDERTLENLLNKIAVDMARVVTERLCSGFEKGNGDDIISFDWRIKNKDIDVNDEDGIFWWLINKYFQSTGWDWHGYCLNIPKTGANDYITYVNNWSVKMLKREI